MDRKYIAFISYRHASLDIAVAERLQKMLERYHVPKEHRQDGAERLGLVFRDRDELPLTSDLTKDICEALDHSQFLIVVCTPETPKSIWVAREIEYFISRHGHNRVLTVLADGTPKESFPPQLTHIWGEDGTMREVEPLCAFIVAKDRYGVLRNLRQEFLRLVSAMLECPYDSLFQREKRRRSHVLALALGGAALVAFCFAGVMVHNYLEVAALNKEIETQLHETQIHESQALSLVSEQKLASGDRPGAIADALAALPSETEDRPFVTEAESALIRALYAYEDEGVRFVSRVEQDTDIYAAALSDDGSFAVTMDESGLVHAYDVRLGTRLWSAQISYADYSYPTAAGTLRYFAVLGDWGVLCANASDATVLSLRDGAVLNTIYYNNSSIVWPSDRQDIFLTEDETQLIVCGGGYVDGDILNGDYLHTLVSYDLLSGRESGRIDLLPLPETPAWYLFDLCSSGDGSLLYAVFSTQFASEEYVILTIDADTLQVVGRYAVSDPQETYFEYSDIRVFSLPYGDVLIGWTRHSYGVPALPGLLHHLTRLSAEGEVLYEVQYVDHYDSYIGKADVMSLLTENRLWCVYESLVLGFDLSDGTVFFENKLPEEALAVLPAPGEDRIALVLANGEVRCMTADGILEETAEDGFDDSGFACKDSFPNPRGDGSFCVIPEQAANCAVFFAPLRDEHAERLAELSQFHSAPEDIEQVSHLLYPFPSGDRILAYDCAWLRGSDGQTSYSRQAEHVLTVYDADTLAVVYRVSFDYERMSYSKFYFDFNGFSADETKVYFRSGVLDLEALTFTLLENLDALQGYVYYGENVAYISGVLCAAPVNHQPTEGGALLAYFSDTLIWWRDGVMQSARHPYDLEKFQNPSACFYGPEIGGSGLAVLRLYTRNWDTFDDEYLGYALYSTEDDRWTWLDNPCAILRDTVRCIGENHLWLALADWDGVLRIYDQNSDSIIREFSLNLIPDAIEEMFFAWEDRVLFIRLSTGRLLAVDADDGAILGQYYLEGDVTRLSIWFDEADGLLYLWDVKSAAEGLCIDLSDWSVRFSVPRMACYVPASHGILRCDKDGMTLLRFPVYTTEELVRWGNQIMNHSIS